MVDFFGDASEWWTEQEKKQCKKRTKKRKLSYDDAHQAMLMVFVGMMMTQILNMSTVLQIYYRKLIHSLSLLLYCCAKLFSIFIW